MSNLNNTNTNKAEVPAEVATNYNALIQSTLSNIKKYKEKGRQLADIFLQLPNKEDYPDYYDIIKNPISLLQMEEKCNHNLYQSIAEFQADFHLMIDNAKVYNRKNSFVYKDAVSLLNLFDSLTKERPVVNPNNAEKKASEPNSLNQELKSIVDQISNHTDEEGHVLSELFQELPDPAEYPDYYQLIKKPIALDKIREKIKNSEYKFKNELAADLNLMFDNAKQYNADYSQVYADAVTLQELTNRLLPNGDLTFLESIQLNELNVEIGDFVYVNNSEFPAKPTIVLVESLWVRNSDKIKGLTGCWFLRPEQTVHKATQKFMENEVFKTNHVSTYKINDVIGKAMVLFVKDFVRGKPKGFEKKDVFVCESRYSETSKVYTKIKHWPSCLPIQIRNKEIDLIPYETPLVLKRDISQLVKEEALNKKRKIDEEPSKPVKTLKAPGVIPEPQRFPSVNWGGISPSVPHVKSEPGNEISSHSDSNESKFKFPKPSLDPHPYNPPKLPIPKTSPLPVSSDVKMVDAAAAAATEFYSSILNKSPVVTSSETSSSRKDWEPVRVILNDLADIWLSSCS